MSLRSASPRPLLEIRDLEVQFRLRRRGIRKVLAGDASPVVRAVDRISLTVSSGELVALVGESGSGKSTTALTVVALAHAHAGSVHVAGQDVLALRGRRLRRLRRRVQMIFQDPYESLDPRFRVRGLVEEPLIIHRLGGSRKERREQVSYALERVGLSPVNLFLERFPHELSGGQRQRVAIASALVLEPDLLVADEPASMLDVSMRAGILDVLDNLRSDGLGILMITHDLSTAAAYADRIAVMYLGRIVEEGPSQQVVNDPRHPYTQALLSVVPRRDPEDQVIPFVLHGEIPDPARVPSGCRFHPRCPVALESCAVQDPEFEWISRTHRAACVLARTPKSQVLGKILSPESRRDS